MDQPISYAMRNHEALQSWLNFNSPAELKDWSFLAIEAILLVGITCSIAHAIRHSRQHGHNSALLTMLGCFTYGLLIDIASYYTVENFWHGEFSVMLVYNRLPLYIALFYPTVIYHLCMTIRRYEFSIPVETISVAFYGGITYLIFDNLGPMLNWWIWDRADPTTWPYLNAVPVTSYFWWFSFTGAFALINRIVCWNWVEAGRSTALQIAGNAAIPVLVCLAGMALFVPYNLLAYDGMIPQAAAMYAISLGLSGLVFVLNFRRPRQPRDRLLMVFPLVFVVGLLYIYIAKFHLFFELTPEGLTAEGLPVGNLIAVVVASIGSLAITLLSHPSEIAE
ncbi:MAG: hypothetical protein GY723_16120 [bacterium]|nr:hypothetical protein [bacterium]MCP5065856.1 hypothetical protein [bacterium]